LGANPLISNTFGPKSAYSRRFLAQILPKVAAQL
jgi:hypothetical protein